MSKIYEGSFEDLHGHKAEPGEAPGHVLPVRLSSPHTDIHIRFDYEDEAGVVTITRDGVEVYRADIGPWFFPLTLSIQD